MGRYLNHSDQGECLRNLLEMVPSGSRTAKTRTPRRVCRRLDPPRVEELIKGYSEGVSVDELAGRFGVDQGTVQKHARRHDLPRWSPRLGPSHTEEAVRLSLVNLRPSCPSTSVSLPILWLLPCAESASRCERGEGGSTEERVHYWPIWDRLDCRLHFAGSVTQSCLARVMGSDDCCRRFGDLVGGSVRNFRRAEIRPSANFIVHEVAFGLVARHGRREEVALNMGASK